jgi:hypothetical protein
MLWEGFRKPTHQFPSLNIDIIEIVAAMQFARSQIPKTSGPASLSLLEDLMFATTSEFGVL